MIGECTVSKYDFERKGYAKVERLFSPEFIESLRGICDATIHDSSFVSFVKNKYNVGIDHPDVLRLIKDPGFGDFMSTITGREMIFTDGIVFELDHTLAGFDWHIGVTSFKYIFPDDYACTIWIPLDPVDREKQNGGMSLLSKSVFSGLEFYKLQTAFTHAAEAGSVRLDAEYLDIAGLRRFNGAEKESKEERFRKAQELTPEAFSDSLYFSQFARELLRQLSESFDYKIGDAMLFDKFVFHKTDVFRAGPMKSRRAFVLRFIDRNARFNDVNARRMGGETSEIIQRIQRGGGNTFDCPARYLLSSVESQSEAPAGCLA
jgi:hypothetical protein